MRITLQDTATKAVKTLATGDIAAQAVASMQVEVSQPVRAIASAWPEDAAADIVYCGGGQVAVSWVVSRQLGSYLTGARGGAMSVTLDDGTTVPCLHGMLTITAADGSGVIIADASVTSSATGAVCGTWWQTKYTVQAGLQVTFLAGGGTGGSLPSPGIPLGELTTDVWALADASGAILVDDNGLALVKEAS